MLRELSTCQWAKDRFEKYTGKPEDENNAHAMDMLCGKGLEDINVERWSFD
ncbi:MAG: hypothetical protein ACLRU1_03425 [Veillonella parvula]